MWAEGRNDRLPALAAERCVVRCAGRTRLVSWWLPLLPPLPQQLRQAIARHERARVHHIVGAAAAWPLAPRAHQPPRSFGSASSSQLPRE
jgi:hypothetical protein